jgi:hypothetical protein
MSEHDRFDVAAEVRAQHEAWMAAWIANDRAMLARIMARYSSHPQPGTASAQPMHAPQA